jgi:hypothetical protein
MPCSVSECLVRKKTVCYIACLFCLVACYQKSNSIYYNPNNQQHPLEGAREFFCNELTEGQKLFFHVYSLFKFPNFGVVYPCAWAICTHTVLLQKGSRGFLFWCKRKTQNIILLYLIVCAVRPSRHGIWENCARLNLFASEFLTVYLFYRL